MAVTNSGSPVPYADRQFSKQMNCLRLTSSAFMIASIVAIVACAVLIGFAQARYIPPVSPLYALCAFAALVIVTVVIDCKMNRDLAKNNVKREDFFRIFQPPPPEAKKKDKDSKDASMTP